MAEYSKELERLARENGFKNATEMALFQRRRSENIRKTEATTISAKGTRPDSAPKKKSESGGGGMSGFFEGLSRVLDRANKK